MAWPNIVWRSRTTTPAAINYLPPNAYDLSGEWGRSDFDRRHRFELLGTINPGNLFKPRCLSLGQFGQPYTLTTGIDQFHTGTANARRLESREIVYKARPTPISIYVGRGISPCAKGRKKTKA